MGKKYNKKSTITHINIAINALKQYFNILTSDEMNNLGKADKLAYWIEKYSSYLQSEDRKKGANFRKYKRGDVVKIDLGFNIGSEYGGLHYAIVLNKRDSIKSDTLTIVPLTSIKPTTKLDSLPPDRVNLGNEIFNSIQAKRKHLFNIVLPDFNDIKHKIENSKSLSEEEVEELESRTNNLEKQISKLEDIQAEITRMKQGSIALVGQITTISKIRIHNPQNKNDALHNIKISNTSLDKIDKKIMELFSKNK